MTILITYGLILTIYCMWRYGLMAIIRNIFKRHLTLQYVRALRKIKYEPDRKRIAIVYKKSMQMLSHLKYKEFLVLLSIARDMAIIEEAMGKIVPEIRSETCKKFMEDALRNVLICLYICTFKGFIYFAFFLLKNMLTDVWHSNLHRFTRAIAQPATVLFILISSFSSHLAIFGNCPPQQVFDTDIPCYSSK